MAVDDGAGKQVFLVKMHEGVDVAEVSIDEHPFNESERVELSKEFTYRTWGGTNKLPKGTKGIIDSLYDRAGEYYYVRTDEGKHVKVPFSYLKRLKKGA